MQTPIFNIVYFSSISNNTHRFILKLKATTNIIKLPIKESEAAPITQNPFILFTPTYAGGFGLTKGAVPKPVIKFLNIKTNQINCKAVVASGNRNFIDTYCLAGDVISKKLNIPCLYKFELLGTQDDVTNVIKICNQFWKENQF